MKQKNCIKNNQHFSSLKIGRVYKKKNLENLHDILYFTDFSWNMKGTKSNREYETIQFHVYNLISIRFRLILIKPNLIQSYTSPNLVHCNIHLYKQVCTINRLPQAELDFLLPYQVLDKRGSISHFRVFRCGRSYRH